MLGAGRGTRLAPLTDSVPKILVPIAGEPLLSRQLRYLAAHGITDVALNLHHLAERVEEYLASLEPPLRVHVYREPTLRGTAGALFPMRDFLTEPFVLLYGDVVTDADLHELERHARGVATLGYYVSEDVQEKGLLQLDESARVVGFVEKPRASTGSGCVNAGIHVLQPSIRRFIPVEGDFGFDVWPQVSAAGEAIYGCKLDAYVADIGSHDVLRQVEEDVAAGRLAW